MFLILQNKKHYLIKWCFLYSFIRVFGAQCDAIGQAPKTVLWNENRHDRYPGLVLPLLNLSIFTGTLFWLISLESEFWEHQCLTMLHDGNFSGLFSMTICHREAINCQSQGNLACCPLDRQSIESRCLTMAMMSSAGKSR